MEMQVGPVVNNPKSIDEGMGWELTLASDKSGGNGRSSRETPETREVDDRWQNSKSARTRDSKAASRVLLNILSLPLPPLCSASSRFLCPHPYPHLCCLHLIYQELTPSFSFISPTTFKPSLSPLLTSVACFSSVCTRFIRS